MKIKVKIVNGKNEGFPSLFKWGKYKLPFELRNTERVMRGSRYRARQFSVIRCFIFHYAMGEATCSNPKINALFHTWHTWFARGMADCENFASRQSRRRKNVSEFRNVLIQALLFLFSLYLVFLHDCNIGFQFRILIILNLSLNKNFELRSDLMF